MIKAAVTSSSSYSSNGICEWLGVVGQCFLSLQCNKLRFMASVTRKYPQMPFLVQTVNSPDRFPQLSACPDI